MKDWKIILSAMAIGAGLCAMPVHAMEGLGGSDVNAGALSLGGRAMYFDPKDGDSTWQGGAQLRMHLSPVWAVEGSVDYRRDHFNDTRVDVFPVQASLLAYLFPGHRLSPFILGGGGWYYTHVKGPNDNPDETDNRFGWHAGAGLEYYLNQWWSLDGTYRYVWIENISSKDSSLLDKDYHDRGQMVTIGLNYHF